MKAGYRRCDHHLAVVDGPFIEVTHLIADIAVLAIGEGARVRPVVGGPSSGVLWIHLSDVRFIRLQLLPVRSVGLVAQLDGISKAATYCMLGQCCVVWRFDAH